MQRIQNSGKGLELEDFQKFKYSNILRQYLHEQSSVKPFDYSKIDTVLILGHSLIADKEFLASVFGSCNNLSHAVIFTYHGEDGNELNRKKAFLSDYCKEIEFEFYDWKYTAWSMLPVQNQLSISTDDKLQIHKIYFT